MRDKNNEKMSKTKGNVVDPLDVVDEYGADSLRFSLVTGVTPGQDVPLSMERVSQNRMFCNKLWNAARFLEPKMEGCSSGVTVDAAELAAMPVFERYIVSEAHACAEASAEALEAYSIGDAGSRERRLLASGPLLGAIRRRKRSAVARRAPRSALRPRLPLLLRRVRRLVRGGVQDALAGGAGGLAARAGLLLRGVPQAAAPLRSAPRRRSCLDARRGAAFS